MHKRKQASTLDAVETPRPRLLTLLFFGALLLWAFLPALPAQGAAATSYEIVDLGTLGGSSSSARAINTSGEIVGESLIADGSRRAFLYSGGTMRDLGTLGGAVSTATGINDSGDVVGESTTAAGETHAFVRSGGVMRDLGTLGGAFSTAAAINAVGDVVGTSTTASGARHAFLYSGGVMRDLGTLGRAASEAYGINDAGQVVGTSSTANGAAFSFIYSGGSMAELPIGGGAEAKAINSSGQVAGTFFRFANEAFLYSGGVITGLGTFSAASFGRNLNDAGDVVGNVMSTQGSTDAFVYSEGVMRDLSTLIPSDAGWSDLNIAWAINDGGEIVGVGQRGDQVRAFLLTQPVGPAVTISDKPADPTRSRSASFAFSSAAGATFECKLDQAVYAACVSSVAYTDLAEGRHSFFVRATDAAGDVGAIETYSWTVDLTPPHVTFVESPPSLTTATDARIAWQGEAGATYRCSLDYVAFSPCTSPMVYTGLAEGPHNVGVIGTDLAGNTLADVSAGVDRVFWTIGTAPSVSLLDKPADPSPSATATFSFAADRTGVGLQCKLDAAEYGSCISPKTYDGLADGAHTFSVRASDTAGNIGPAVTYTWTVDTRGPAVVIVDKPTDPSTSTEARFDFSSVVGATFECSLDGSPYTTCTSPRDIIGLSAGRHAFSVRATDTFGRVGAVETYSWTIEIPAPTPPALPSGQERLQATRDALELKKTQVPAAARMYVQFAIDGLNRVLEASRWTSTGLALNAQSRDTLAELRMAAGWLYWADPAVQTATLDEQRQIIRGMGEVVRKRFNEVFNFVGEGTKADPWALWASEYLLNEGDSALTAGWHLSASLYYASAWDYLLNQPPCC